MGERENRGACLQVQAGFCLDQGLENPRDELVGR